MSNIAERDQALNDRVLGGDILGAFEEFYHPEVSMQEGSKEPTVGKDANREREKQFVESIGEFHGAGITATASSGETTFSEWWMDVTFKDGTRKKLEQVAVRRWQDGQVAEERFYYDSAG